MRKVLIAGTIAAGMAISALPAFAWYHPTSRTNVESKNITKVNTVNVSASNSGLNGVNQNGGFKNEAEVKTGVVYAEADGRYPICWTHILQNI